MRVSALKWGLKQPKTMSLNQLYRFLLFFLTFLQIFKEGQKQGEMPHVGILVFGGVWSFVVIPVPARV